MELPSEFLWLAFEDGRRFTKGGGEIAMECRDAGTLVLPTGRLVACDPVFNLAPPPFEVHVEPGAYPTFLSLAFGAVALVMIQFGEGTPTRWVTHSSELCDVDSASACFMDAKLCRLLLRRSEQGKWDVQQKRIKDAMIENGGRWGNVCLHADSGANMLVFQTFGGDGSFATYWGYSSRGELVCAIMDMFLQDGAEAV